MTTGLAAVLSCLILFAGACLQGLTGFGYSLLSLPLLALMMPISEAVPMLSLTSIFLNAMVYIHARKSTSVKRILPLLIAGAAGLPLGIWALKSIEGDTVKSIVGLLVMLTSVLYLAGFRLKLHRERLAMLPVGLASGILNGATSLSGPPVILFLTNQIVGKDTFRGSLAVYFLLLNIIAAPAFIAGGLLNGAVAVGTAWRFPFVIAGALIGSKLSGVMGENRFRKAALVLLLLLGAGSVLTAI